MKEPLVASIVRPASQPLLSNKGIRGNGVVAARLLRRLSENKDFLSQGTCRDVACRVSTETSFSPHSTNKTTAVAEMNTNHLRPHYLINTIKNEVRALRTTRIRGNGIVQTRHDTSQLRSLRNIRIKNFRTSRCTGNRFFIR